MTEWFRDRYISRSEHQEIIAFYRSLVAQLHVKVRDLRARLDAQPSATGAEPRGGARRTAPEGDVDWSPFGENVIPFDPRRRHRVDIF